MQAAVAVILGLALMVSLLVGGLLTALLFLVGVSWVVDVAARVFGGSDRAPR